MGDLPEGLIVAQFEPALEDDQDDGLRVSLQPNPPSSMWKAYVRKDVALEYGITAMTKELDEKDAEITRLKHLLDDPVEEVVETLKSEIARLTEALEFAVSNHQTIVTQCHADLKEADASSGSAWRLLRRYKSKVRSLNAAVKAETERCAQVVESLWAYRTCQEVADAIRAE